MYYAHVYSLCEHADCTAGRMKETETEQLITEPYGYAAIAACMSTHVSLSHYEAVQILHGAHVCECMSVPVRVCACTL